MTGIWAIILAAGESKRMGFPKMLLNFKGRTMLETVISNVRSSAVDNVLVVLGAEFEKLKPVVEMNNVMYCLNERYRDGMLSSVKYAFDNIGPDYVAAMVFPGDQPLITSDTINKVIEAYRSTGMGIVIPVFKGKRGHPVLIDRKYSADIGKLNTNEGLRSLAKIFRDDVLEVTTEDEGILKDFDTFDEYNKEVNQ